MKLVATNYKDPKGLKGTFEYAEIEDFMTILHRKSNTYIIKFSLKVGQKNNLKQIAESSMIFRGLESEIDSGKTTNQPSLVSVPNPDYDENYIIDENEDREIVKNKTTPFFIKNMIEHLTENQGNLNNATIIDYGYPTFEKSKEFFIGGDLQNPEISINNQIALGFLLKKLIINGEPVGNQFSLKSNE